MSIYKDILEKLNTGQKIVMLTTLGGSKQSGKSQSKKAYYTEADLETPRSNVRVSFETRQLIQQALATGELQIVSTSDKKLLVAEPFFPEPRLIIFGGGHIGKALCEFGAKLGFSITVVDDRIEFANAERFPDADQVICESFEKSFELLQFNPYTYVVIVTRGHRHDLICLREVAKKPWAYAGMIGARRRVEGVKEQLISEGTPREILEKVNAPIGLDIGAVTPGELAISILGQVISYRRLENPKMGRESARIMWTEFDRDVIEALSLGRNGERALATVLSTRGSAPRRAGAKMLVWADGRILGSVGGGLAEGKVIQSARDIIRKGGYLIQNFDLNGCIADEGMVCGGDMSVLIESVKSR
ncbi:MAG: XdhC/CoxI family protein [Dehalococcoidia bacterium]